MQFEVGDTVALTGATLLTIAQNHPEVFERLRDGNRTGGKITKITDEYPHDDLQNIVIDMGEALDRPLALEVNIHSPQLSLQLIKKAQGTDLVEPSQLPPHPSLPVPPEDGSVSYAAMTPSGELAPGIVPPPVVEAIKEMARQDAGNFARHFVPQQIHLAQWVMTQFIGLKQYVIVQDLNRDVDDEDQEPIPGDEWKHGGEGDGDGKVKRIQLSLADGEEKLYNAAMTRIQDWIEQVDVPEPPVVPTIEPPAMPTMPTMPTAEELGHPVITPQDLKLSDADEIVEVESDGSPPPDDVEPA